MKRGKDDDKTMGPMFPRLHVNDTEKGGPRAPPRNKMALYEQLTIPSHRYNSGAVPLNHSNNSNLVPSTSTNQRMGRERNMYFPLYRSSPAPSYDEHQARNTEAVSSSGQAEQADSRKKPPEEDDFMVPIFSQAGKEPSDSKIQNTIERERKKHLNASSHVMPLSYGDEEANQSGGGDHAPRQHVINQDGRSLGAFDASTRYPDTLMREKDGGLWRDGASLQKEHAEQHRLSSLEKTDSCLRHDLEDSVPALHTRYGGDASDQVFRSLHRGVPLSLKHNPRMECGYTDGNEVDDGPQKIADGRSLERENEQRVDDVSETSMVDCASGLDISPDDIVGILGRKHFWKARTAIVNQQRVFAVQVFELHRLIKVQKLIAGSPHLLLEGSAIVEKATLNRSAVKQYSSDYTVKALAHNIEQKDDSQKPADRLEGTAENAVTKAPILLPQSAIQPAGYPPFPISSAPSPPINTDPKMNPWSFHQPTAHQWLVPVMSPSEGLVYKPYPAPGFMSPTCGGCGPTPMPGNLMNSPYGAPTPPPYHQGMGMPFGGQGYFFPYGIPMMSPAGSGSAVDQTNPFSGPNPYGQMGQPGGGSIVQHQSSCNMPNQKKGTTPPPALRAPPPKEVELQGSTASSTSDRAQAPEMAPPPPEGRDALPLFPTAPTMEISEAAPPTEDRSRVIKVVPHNPLSTKESAARIFQSIQEERRRHESS